MEKKTKAKPAKKTVKPKGAPTKYTPAMCKKAKELAEKGYYNQKIAEELGISNATLHNFMNAHPAFLDAIKQGKAIADEKVELTLYEMATGYSHRVEKPVVVGTGQGESMVEIVEYTERLPPNMTAIIFHLKNRKPQEWRDKQEVEQVGSIEIKHTFDPQGI